MITKLAIFVGGVVLMAGVALAGTMTGLGSGNSPAGQTISPPAATPTGILDDRGQENEPRGRENEAGEDLRGREDEAGEDLRGPCDEAEHANDPRAPASRFRALTTTPTRSARTTPTADPAATTPAAAVTTTAPATAATAAVVVAATTRGGPRRRLRCRPQDTRGSARVSV